ncbi:unnamed protein product [Caenorhabditis auriculariae]|uniref:Tetraspanin n=1 Tax=Caenorhabditis auriculariae TaxID=2777116 RepID=A0A8S1H5M6_9PELO|nr:unnamed protein product [Caenorhabditis auriculariae]
MCIWFTRRRRSRRIAFPTPFELVSVRINSEVADFLDTTMTPKRRVSPSSECSPGWMKCITICFASMTLISGVLLVLLSIFLFLEKTKFMPLLHSQQFLYCVYMAGGCGALVLMGGFLPCCAIHNRCVMSFYVFLLTLSIVAEIFLCFSALGYVAASKEEVNKTLLYDIQVNYKRDPIIKHTIDRMQQAGKCCGAHAFNDYPKNNTEEYEGRGYYYQEMRLKKVQYVPDSCCYTYAKGCALSDGPSNIRYQGCQDYLLLHVRECMHFITICAVTSIILAIITIICCFVVCGLPRKNETPPSKYHDQELYLFG